MHLNGFEDLEQLVSAASIVSFNELVNALLNSNNSIDSDEQL